MGKENSTYEVLLWSPDNVMVSLQPDDFEEEVIRSTRDCGHEGGTFICWTVYVKAPNPIAALIQAQRLTKDKEFA